MEQVLNLAWLLVALVTVVVWLRHRRRAQGHPCRARLVWQIFAISVVLLFLFFAISIEDDLHWTVIATEASEGSRKLVKSDPSRGPVAISGAHVAVVSLAASLWFAACAFGAVDRAGSIGSPAAGVCHDFSGRSPPSLS